MPPKKTLMEEATRIVAEFQKKKARLERERLSLQEQLAENDAALEATDFAEQRLAELAVELRRDRYCPRCWIDGHARSLTPIPGTDTEDRFRCRECGFQWSEPA